MFVHLCIIRMDERERGGSYELGWEVKKERKVSLYDMRRGLNQLQNRGGISPNCIPYTMRYLAGRAWRTDTRDRLDTRLSTERTMDLLVK